MKITADFLIRSFCEADIPLIVEAFRAHNWPKPRSTFDLYLQEQETVERLV